MFVQNQLTEGRSPSERYRFHQRMSGDLYLFPLLVKTAFQPFQWSVVKFSECIGLKMQDEEVYEAQTDRETREAPACY